MSGWRDRLDPRRLAAYGLGVLLLIGGIGLLAITEQGLIGYRGAVARDGGEVLDLGRDAMPDPALQGRLVRVSGPLVVDGQPRDPDFNLRDDTPRLIRQVAMFQWRQLDLGGEVRYQMDWVDHPVDSRRFREAAGHTNPTAFPVQGLVFRAGRVRIGRFVLSDALLRALPGSVAVSPQLARLPANLAATFSTYQDALVTSTRPGAPRLGDLKIDWVAVPLQELTVLARVDGEQLVAAKDLSGGQGYAIAAGDVPLSQMRPKLPDVPQWVMLRRIVGLLLAILGALALAWRQRLERPDPLLAVGAGVAPAAAVAGVLWTGVDGSCAAGWLGLAAVAAAFALWRWSGRRARSEGRPS